MRNKIKVLLAILLCVSSPLFSLTEYEDYVLGKIKTAKLEGRTSVVVNVPSKYSKDALILAAGVIGEGGYVEANRRTNGSETLTISWSTNDQSKQVKILEVANSMVTIFAEGQKDCDEKFVIFGIYNNNYYGNFYAGCGEEFARKFFNSKTEYRDFDYINMLCSVIIQSNKRGYILEAIPVDVENLNLFSFKKAGRINKESDKEKVLKKLLTKKKSKL